MQFGRRVHTGEDGGPHHPWWWVNGIHYPLVNIQKAMENGPFIIDLPIKNDDFP
jgi:hypothetical protein